MTNKTQRIKSIKSKVETIWKNPKSHSLENHYKFMRMILQKEYPKTFENISPETIETMLQELVYLDRFLRRKREGNQNELKQELSNQFKQIL